MRPPSFDPENAEWNACTDAPLPCLMVADATLVPQARPR